MTDKNQATVEAAIMSYVANNPGSYWYEIRDQLLLGGEGITAMRSLLKGKHLVKKGFRFYTQAQTD